MFEDKIFIIIPFRMMPLSQVFRYRNEWWTRGLGVSKDHSGVEWGGWREGCRKNIEKDFIIIDRNELVATEQCFLTKFMEEIHRTIKIDS